MLRRKALFIEITKGGPTADTLDLVRDYAGMGYIVVPVCGPGIDADLAEVVRLETGAALTRALLLRDGFAPQRVWEFARSQQLDLDRSTVIAESNRHDGVFLTAGVRRIIRPSRAQFAAA